MSESVKMPALGESVTEGTVTQWLKSVGDTIEVDEPLLEVSTDKVDTEVPSPMAGTIEKILVEEDETVEVGEELVIIGDGSGSDDSAGDDSTAEQAQEEPEPDTSEQTEQEPEPDTSDQEPAADTSSDDSSGGGDGTPITMPALGESVTEGTVTQWLKSVGDTIEVDEPLLEVSTDKVDTEVPSPVGGTIQKLLVEEDETVEVGTELAIVGDGSGGQPAESSSEPAESSQSKQEPAPQPTEEVEDEPTEAEAEDKAEAPEPEDEADKPEPEAKQETAPEPAPKRDEPKQESPPKGGEEPPSVGYVTPIVRKLAREKGVDLSGLSGSGVGGRIRKQDVLDAAEAAEKAAAAPAPEAAAPAAAPEKSSKPTTIPEPSSLRGTTEKMSGMRRTIARRMMESIHGTAQLTTVVEVDVTRIVDLRNKVKNTFQANEGTKLTFLPFFIKAAIEALKAHPKLNARIEDNSIVYHDAEHIGVAVDTDRGLAVPVVKDAGDLNVGGLAKRVADIATRTRDRKVSPDELTGSTFTVTNTGSAGALFDTPILNTPEVGILGVANIVRRPVAVTDADGHESIGIRSMIYLSLTYDHQLVDGADAGRFLQTVKARLEEGAFGAEFGV